MIEAYAARFAADMERFLSARAEEMVEGGLMVMICLGVCDGISASQLPFRILYDNLAYALLDMANQVNSFSLYCFFAKKLVG